MLKNIVILIFVFTVCASATEKINQPLLNDKCAENFLTSDEVISLNQRYIQYEQAYLQNDFQKYKEILWKSHDNRVNANILKGYQYKMDYLRSWYRRTWYGLRGNINYIPGHYQFFDTEHQSIFVIETLAIIGQVADEAKKKKAIELGHSWIKEYSTYHQRLNNKIDEGFEAKLEVPYLEEALNKYSFEDFLGTDEVIIKLPEIKNGKLKIVNKAFSSKNALKHYYEKTVKTKIKNIFPKKRSLNSKLRNSEIDHILVGQALMRRRLSFLLDKLRDIKEHRRDPIQVEFIGLIEKALHSPLLNPRSDAVSSAYRKEFFNEIRAIFMFKKGSERQKQLNLNFVQEQAQEQTKKLYSNMKKMIVLVAMGGVTAGATALMTPFTENEIIRKYQEGVRNWINNTLLDWGFITNIQKECTEEGADREWSIQEVCYNKFIYAHLSLYLLKSKYDGYDLKDEEGYFYKRRAELTQIYLEKLFDNGFHAFHSDNKKFLNESGYPAFVNNTFLYVLRDELKGNDEAVATAMHYILARQDAEADSVVQQRKQKLEAMITSDKMELIESHITYFDKMVEAAQKSGELELPQKVSKDDIRAKELNDFMDMYEKKDGIIDMLNPFNPNSPLHPKNPFYKKDTADKFNRSFRDSDESDKDKEEDNNGEESLSGGN